VIGTISIASRKSETTVRHTTIEVRKTTKAENIKKLGEFLENLRKQEEAAEKVAGSE